MEKNNPPPSLPDTDSRRNFLKQGIFIMGGLITAGIGVPAVTYFLAPLWQKEEEDWTEVGTVAELPVGEPFKIDFVQRKRDGWMTVEGRSSAWAVTVDGEQFTVFDPRCTHLGCPYRWDAEKKKFLCPCHNAVFSVTGEVLAGPPPRPLDRFPVKVAGGKLFIKPAQKKGEG
ncbi:MAG: Rieske (2Fe-2S) protein [Deltaproteobacteria bacterium]|nr:Rieske (2Fe-2S) protein [Deltaproteobacteria bacterium]